MNIKGGVLMIQTENNKSSDSVWKRLFSVLIISLFLTATLGLSGCSNWFEGQDGENVEESSGQIVIGLTDDTGDFVSYTVNVSSLTLTKAGGAVVNVLPLSTQVDFAQYTEMTEFLTAASIPSGKYSEATLTLDYQDAEIWVEDPDGDTVEVESILDEDGNPITTLEVSVHLEGRSALLIAPGIPAHLTLDFNLSASNNVTFDQSGSAVLTVQPVLLAEVNAQAPKIHRLRGSLKEMDETEGTFGVIVRPFLHIMSGSNESFGVLKVITNDDTIYEINKENYLGQAGLSALGERQVLTAIVVHGDLKFNPPRFRARQVYAGSSVPGGEMDVVTGNVISRENNVLTVKGATLIRSGGSVVFNNTLTVQLGVYTAVKRQFSLEQYNIDNISVGQRVTVFGTLNNEETELNAIQGHVRMLLTTLKGRTLDNGPPWFVIDLNSIDRRRVRAFDFSGTGTDAENNADPAHYEIDIGSLNVSSLPLETPVKVRGFVNAFGQAPEDFEAQTVVDVSNVMAFLTMNWGRDSTTAFTSVSSEALTLNLEAVGLFHHLTRVGVVIDLTELLTPPLIQPYEEGLGLFTISQDGAHKLHLTFEGFVTDLQDRLADNGIVKSLSAIGHFNDSTSTLTAGTISIKIR
jgi:hypothetical protein